MLRDGQNLTWENPVGKVSANYYGCITQVSAAQCSLGLWRDFQGRLTISSHCMVNRGVCC